MKGISPLIAAVLLIAFTVAIATLIMGWMSAYTRTTTSNVSSQSEEAVECGSAAIKINHVYVWGTDNLTNTDAAIVIENTGFKDFTNINYGLYNSTGGSCTADSSNVNLAKGEITRVTLDCQNVNMSSTSFDRAIVTTECGGVSDYTDKTSDVDFT
jgi:flagellin-like protein